MWVWFPSHTMGGSQSPKTPVLGNLMASLLQRCLVLCILFHWEASSAHLFFTRVANTSKFLIFMDESISIFICLFLSLVFHINARIASKLPLMTCCWGIFLLSKLSILKWIIRIWDVSKMICLFSWAWRSSKNIEQGSCH